MRKMIISREKLRFFMDGVQHIHIFQYHKSKDCPQNYMYSGKKVYVPEIPYGILRGL